MRMQFALVVASLAALHYVSATQETTMRDVEVENAKFSLSFKQKPGAPARTVRSADADSIRVKKLPDGDAASFPAT